MLGPNKSYRIYLFCRNKPSTYTRKRFDIFRMNKNKEVCIQAIFDYYIKTETKKKASFVSK